MRYSSLSQHLLILSLFLLLATACNEGQAPTLATATPLPAPTSTPSTGRGVGGTLRLVYWQAPGTLNPYLATGAKDWDPSRITYEPLATVDDEGNLVPILAAEIPSLANGGLAEDGRSVTWTLKEDVRWSDGEPFTAEDVLFTYNYITNPEVGVQFSSNYDTIERVEVVDPLTVRIHFQDVNPGWFLPFVGQQGTIIPHHVFESYNGPNAADAPANLQPVGTGPYRVVAFRPQEVLFLGNELVQTVLVVYEPNPYYRNPQQPHFSRVELRGGGTVNEAARLALETGAADYAWNLQLDATTLAALTESADGGELVTVFGPFVERMLLNRTDPNRETETGERSSLQFPHPFFSDSRVRQAFAHAVDRQRIAGEVYGNTARAAYNNLVSPANYRSEQERYPYDLERAAALLDEAGWIDSDGDRIRDKEGTEMSVVIQTTTGSVREQTLRIVQEDLQSLGIEVTPELIEPSIFFSGDTSNPNILELFYADMEEYLDGNFSPDPGAYMSYWTCDEIPQQANNWTGLNTERYCNPQYDTLYEQSTAVVDPEEREALFIRMNDILIEDVVMIPIVNTADVFGLSNDLTGVQPTPWDANTWNINNWRRMSP